MKINSGGRYSDRSTVSTNPSSGLLTQRPIALPYTGWIIKDGQLVMAICHLETTGKLIRFTLIRGSLSTKKRESGKCDVNNCFFFADMPIIISIYIFDNDKFLNNCDLQK